MTPSVSKLDSLLWRFWLKGLALTCLALLLPRSTGAQTLCLVRNHTPDGVDSRYSRSTILIDSFAVYSGTLARMWSLPENQCFIDLKLYSSARILLIGAARNPYNSAEKLYVVPFDSVSAASCLDLKDLGTVWGYRYLQTPSGMGQVEVEYRLQNETLRKTLCIAAGQVVDSLASAAEYLRLAGPGTRFSGGQEDLISVAVDSGRVVRVTRDSTPVDGVPIPDSIIHRKTSYGWIVFANEPALMLLESVAERGDYTDRELLIYDRPHKMWSSMLVPGISTSLRFLNGWVVGVIADDPPGTDYVKRHGGEPVLREEVVFVRPLEQRQFAVHIGPKSEILWIEADIVYYRTGEELYQARIKNCDFTERKLLMRHRLVSDIHWAFSTSR